MKKQHKNDFFVTISYLSHSADKNADAIQKLMNGQNAEAEKTDEAEIKTYLKKLENTFFTPAEREDLFIITNHLWSLSDGTFKLYEKTRNTNIFKISDSERKNASVLKKATEKCNDLTAAFSNLPKCGNITDLYISVREICCDGLSDNKETDINDCLKLCQSTAEAIYYAYLKNT